MGRAVPGTVVIEPPPPTVSDPPPAPQVAPPPRARGRGCLVAVAALCTLACVMVAVGYFGFWRYEPHAREHIPDRTNVAVRFEAADFILFGPVRRHLWPMLEESRPEP